MTWDRGEALGCPDCATGEPHVCPFLLADSWPEPRRGRALAHMAAEISEIRLTPDERKLQ